MVQHEPDARLLMNDIGVADVKSAVVVLTIQGVWCITVTVDRLLMLFLSKRRSRRRPCRSLVGVDLLQIREKDSP